ncbi:hypothetical protein OG21DRAFT_1516968 [Imleria badia]|nr:hypothetical protein OG21DRAFT_1516968 [Imleria badia]
MEKVESEVESAIGASEPAVPTHPPVVSSSAINPPPSYTRQWHPSPPKPIHGMIPDTPSSSIQIPKSITSTSSPCRQDPIPRSPPTISFRTSMLVSFPVRPSSVCARLAPLPSHSRSLALVLLCASYPCCVVQPPSSTPS